MMGGLRLRLVCRITLGMKFSIEVIECSCGRDKKQRIGGAELAKAHLSAQKEMLVYLKVTCRLVLLHRTCQLGTT